MRSSRGYLDTLVRSARPPGGAARAAVQPDWGPTRIAEPADEPAPVMSRRVTPAARAEIAPEPIVSPRAASVDSTAQAMDAAPRRTPEPGEPHIVEVIAPATVPAPAPVPVTRQVTEPAVASPAAAVPATPPTPPTEVARPVAHTARESLRPASLPLPPGTEAALQRLEHLARRFTAAYAQPEPEPAPEAPRATPVEPSPEPRRTDAPVVTLEPAPAFAAPRPAPPERERVEIGSIEVFVTQPSPAPAPGAASTPPPRVIAPAAAPSRLSRPANAYGFGQG